MIANIYLHATKFGKFTISEGLTGYFLWSAKMKSFSSINGLLFAAFLTVLPFSLSAKTFYCSENVSTGFIKDKDTRKFRIANFNTDRFAIQFSSDFDKLRGIYKDETFACSRPYNTSTILSCLSPWEDGAAFLFDPDTGRFELLKPSMFGYVNNGTDTSSYSIGVCETF